jgi:O-antigen ligase
MKKYILPFILFLIPITAILIIPQMAGFIIMGSALLLVIFFTSIKYPELLLYLMIIAIFLPFSIKIGLIRLALSDILALLAFTTWSFKALMLRKDIYIPRFFIFTTIFLISTILSIYSTLNITNSLKEIAQFLQFTFIYIITINNVINNNNLIKNLLKTAVYSAFVIASLAIMYFLMGNVDGLYNLGFHKNALGSLMALSFPLALMNSRNYKSLNHFIMMVIIAGGLGVSLSRGAWLGAATGVMIMEMIYHRRHLLQNFVIVAIGILFVFSVMPHQFKSSATSTHTLDIRKEQWDIARYGFIKNPITGIGYANFLELSSSFDKARQHDDPHNIVMRFAAEIGIIGLLAFFTLFTAIYYYAAKTINSELADKELRWFEIGIFASLIAYLIHGMFDVFWVRGTGSFFWILVSIMVLLHERKDYLEANKNE